MKQNKYGEIVLNEDDLFDHIMADHDINFPYCVVDKTVSIASLTDQVPNAAAWQYDDQNVDVTRYDQDCQARWLMPDEFQNFPLVHWLYSKCTTDEQIQRVDLELELFIKHNLLDVLFYLMYLVNTMTHNNIIWGVGRGSSVASYVLFLIGVHKVDSIKYNLDIREFLR